MSDQVNHPPHYRGKHEPIKVIEDWKLGFRLGNAVKYIARAEKKGSPIQDLEKAAWYLAREIKKRKKADRKAAKNELRDHVRRLEEENEGAQ